MIKPGIIKGSENVPRNVPICNCETPRNRRFRRFYNKVRNDNCLGEDTTIGLERVLSLFQRVEPRGDKSDDGCEDGTVVGGDDIDDVGHRVMEVCDASDKSRVIERVDRRGSRH